MFCFDPGLMAVSFLTKLISNLHQAGSCNKVNRHLISFLSFFIVNLIKVYPKEDVTSNYPRIKIIEVLSRIIFAFPLTLRCVCTL